MSRCAGFKRGIRREGFSCGKPDLDEWIQRYAGQSERNDTARTFLALGDDDELVGYYATKACELDLDEASSVYGVGRRRYPVPAMLIARLAVRARERRRAAMNSLRAEVCVVGSSSGPRARREGLPARQ